MAQGRVRTGPIAPLGKWVWEKAQARGFKSKTELYGKLGISNPAFNAWSSFEAAVPQQQTLDRLRQVLRLNQDERLELEDVLREQQAYRAEHEPRTESVLGPMRIDAPPVVPPAERTVEYDDPYPNRATALAAWGRAVEDLKRISNAEGDKPVEWWLTRLAKMASLRAETEQRIHAIVEGDDAFDVRPTLPAASAKGRKR